MPDTEKEQVIHRPKPNPELDDAYADVTLARHYLIAALDHLNNIKTGAATCPTPSMKSISSCVEKLERPTTSSVKLQDSPNKT